MNATLLDLKIKSQWLNKIKKHGTKGCLFFKQARSSYKNSILRNTFNNLSTSAVDNFTRNKLIDFKNDLRVEIKFHFQKRGDLVVPPTGIEPVSHA
jgi:hypothetical protein